MFCFVIVVQASRSGGRVLQAFACSLHQDHQVGLFPCRVSQEIVHAHLLLSSMAEMSVHGLLVSHDGSIHRESQPIEVF